MKRKDIAVHIGINIFILMLLILNMYKKFCTKLSGILVTTTWHVPRLRV